MVKIWKSLTWRKNIFQQLSISLQGHSHHLHSYDTIVSVQESRLIFDIIKLTLNLALLPCKSSQLQSFQKKYNYVDLTYKFSMAFSFFSVLKARIL